MHPAVKYTLIALGALFALLLTSVLVLGLMDWNAFKGPAARIASKASGKAITIDGDLTVKLLSLHPHFSVEGLKVANPKWAQPGTLADVGKLAVELELLPLFVGNVILTRVEVDGARLDLHRDAAGRGTWESGTTTPQTRAKPLQLPAVQRFVMRDGRIHFVDARRKLELDATVVASEQDSDQEDQRPFRLDGTGKINGQVFRLRARGGPLINLDQRTPYGFNTEVRAGDTRFKLAMRVPRPFDMSEFEADIDLSGSDLADFYYLTELALPNTPPYSLSGKLQREGTRFQIADLAGKLGGSDIRGDATIETASGRAHVRGEFASDKLDFKDLAASLGATPSAGNSDKGQKEARAATVGERLLPDAKLDVTRVRGMDADVKFKAESVNAPKLPLRKVAMNVVLKGGVLTIKPMSFEFPQGAITADVRLDATTEVPHTELDARLSKLRLEQFFKGKGDAPPALQGSVQGRAQLRGSGRSVHEFASKANGMITVVVPEGEVRQAFAELTGINVAEGLGLLLAKDQEKTNVRCGVAAFEIDEGKVNAQTVVFDTNDVLIVGDGGIDLDSEKLDFRIKGQPKKLRLVRLRTPIEVKGVLRKPSVGIEGGKVAVQGGVAAALGTLLTPVAALLAFVDPGLAKDANCSALLAQAKSEGVSTQATH